MEFVQPIRDRKKIEAMKRYLKGTNYRDYCLFVLGINSGLRISDLLKLEVSDVYENGKFKDRIMLREKKTGKEKSFPLGDTTIKALKEYFDTRILGDKDEPLFPSQKGKLPMTRQHAYRILNGAARSVGIYDRIGTHTLRKTFGYFLYTSGVDITRIQKLLNHSSPSITLAYIGITQEELDDIYLTLNL